MASRSEAKALAAIQDIKTHLPSAQIHFLALDLSSLRSVVDAARTLCSRESSLHGLVNNAGIMGVPFAKTQDGYEVQLQVSAPQHRLQLPWKLTLHYRRPIIFPTGFLPFTCSRFCKLPLPLRLMASFVLSILPRTDMHGFRRRWASNLTTWHYLLHRQ